MGAQAPLKLRSDHLGRYGQAYLQTEKPENGRAVYIHYGYGKGHSHADCLSLGLLAKNVDMAPDHGYPEFTGGWPQRGYVTRNTISHNTVVVNELPQKTNWVGQPELFCQQEDFGAVRVDSREMYAGLQKYQRTVAFIKVGEGQACAEDKPGFDKITACFHK